MSRASFCLVALLVLPAAVCAQPPAPARDTSPRTGTAMIRGRVLVDGTDHPLPRTRILATSEKGQTFDANTEGNGRYELKQLPAGIYTVAANRPNYVRRAFGQKRENGAGTRINVADGATIEAVDFTLVRAGVISGRVVDELGEPVADVQVSPMRSQFMNGASQMMQTGRGATTNDLGEFRIFGLTPGRYYIAATYRSSMGGDSDDRSGYAPTYYPGTGNTAQAQRLSIAAGQTIASINFTLLPVRTVKVSGTVFDARGRPIGSGFINTFTRPFTGGGAGAAIRPDGKFTITGLTPGDYALRVSLPGNSESATMPITIAESDVTDVQLVTSKPPTIRGRVVLDDSAPAPKGENLRFFLQADLPIMGGGSAQVKTDFTFETTMAAGAHARVTFFGGDWRVRAVRLDGADVTDAGFDVPPAGIDGLVVELSARHADLSGTVVDVNGVASRDYVVLIFPQNADQWTRPNIVFSTRPPADGAFKLKVPGGDYYAVALEEIEQGMTNDPDVLGQLRDRAQRLSIADGETRSLVMKLSPPVVY